jgi:arsenate reductase
MAAAFFNQLVDRNKAQALSAGTAPADRIHPEVIRVMNEAGVELAGRTPQRLTGDLTRGAGWLITMGCGDQCPFVPGARVEDWPLADPKGRPLDEVRAIRDDIQRRVESLIAREGWG